MDEFLISAYPNKPVVGGPPPSIFIIYVCAYCFNYFQFYLLYLCIVNFWVIVVLAKFPCQTMVLYIFFQMKKSIRKKQQPRIVQPPNNRQAQGHYVTDEQCIHIPANMITHCLRNIHFKLLIHYTLKTLLRRFPCGCNLYSNLKRFC